MNLRKTTLAEAPQVWEILQDAIAQRKKEGSQQWQDGYPNWQTVLHDIEKEQSYVVEEQGKIVACAAIIFGVEPTYEHIDGKWLSEDAYVVVHRVATAESYKGKGLATQLFHKIEALALAHNTYSIKVDTNFDNLPMLKILEKAGYTYCGEISVRGLPRKAFEKLL